MATLGACHAAPFPLHYDPMNERRAICMQGLVPLLFSIGLIFFAVFMVKGIPLLFPFVILAAILGFKGLFMVDPNEAPPAKPSPSKQPDPNSGPVILVIDDDPHMCELTTRALGKEGYRVVCAANGEQGLAMARELRPATRSASCWSAAMRDRQITLRFPLRAES